jgi:hypothetical protein
MLEMRTNSVLLRWLDQNGVDELVLAIGLALQKSLSERRALMRKVAFTLTVVAAVIAAFAVPAKTGQPSLMISNWNKAGPVEKVTYWRRYYRRYGYAAPYAYYPPHMATIPTLIATTRQRTFIGRTPIMRHRVLPALLCTLLRSFAIG